MLYIGTSGWSYKHWRGLFYPAELSQSKWLEFYARTFATVEINSSFYRLPKRETFELWRERTPQEFIFAVKASRYITHVKKLKGAEEALEKFLRNANGLGEKLGPILFQFPANWRANLERLDGFIKILPPNYRYAFEFRHESWFSEDTYTLLRGGNAALCIADSPQWPISYEITSPFTFIRLHGGQILYASEYSDVELSRWAEIIAGFLSRRLDVFVYFNNDAFGYAVKNAQYLKRLLDT
ncbi:MAG: DUF72 domain-containing protein [Actinobacteria bacterium]|nr:DUF72 domain-containing protein [Actinomycetota bacterium]